MHRLANIYIYLNQKKKIISSRLSLALNFTFVNAFSIFLRTRDVINISRLIFQLTIDRDAIWIGRNTANIYRDTSQSIIDISRRIDVNSFISLSIKIEDTEYIPGQIKLCAIGRCVVVNQSKVLSYNFHYWYVHLIIYVYCHNKCTTLLLFKPLGTRVKC